MVVLCLGCLVVCLFTSFLIDIECLHWNQVWLCAGVYRAGVYTAAFGACPVAFFDPFLVISPG